MDPLPLDMSAVLSFSNSKFGFLLAVLLELTVSGRERLAPEKVGSFIVDYFQSKEFRNAAKKSPNDVVERQ